VGFRLEYDRWAFDDLDLVDPFDLPVIRRAVATLMTQGDTATRNRRPLREAISWCPEANWQLRVRGYRVLYRLEGGIVLVLRVKWKGSRTTEEMGR
jgi:mRNA-degrading endonuclease RelE of RelBE toxin-antitoxin system